MLRIENFSLPVHRRMPSLGFTLPAYATFPILCVAQPKYRTPFRILSDIITAHYKFMNI